MPQFLSDALHWMFTYNWQLCLLLAAATLAIYLLRCNRKRNYVNLLTLLNLMAIPVAFGMLTQYSYWLTTRLTNQDWWASILQSVRYTAHAFAIEDTLGAVWDRCGLTPDQFPPAMQGYYSAMMVLAPLSTLSFAVSFFKTPTFWARFYTRWGVEVYFFSDVNERSLMYAQAILARHTERDDHRHLPMIVFCTDEDQAANAVEAVNIPGAMVLPRSITGLHIYLRAARMEDVHFYLVTDDENKKIQQARELQEKYRGTGCHICCISARKTNDYEVDALNSNSRLWDEQISTLPQKRGKCRLLILGDEPPAADGKPCYADLPRGVLTVICSVPAPQRRLWTLLRHGVVLLKRDVAALPGLTWLSRRGFVTFCLNRDDDNTNRMLDQAQRIHRLRGTHGCTILTLNMGPSRAVDANQHMLTFQPDGSLPDKDQHTARHIRSNAIDLMEEASLMAYVHLNEHCLFDEKVLRAFYGNARGSIPAARKPFRVLILGSGSVGEELARVCLWYCQLPGMCADVTVADMASSDLIAGRILKGQDTAARKTSSGAYLIDADLPRSQTDPALDESTSAAVLRVQGDVDFRTGELETLLTAVEDQAHGYHAIFICSGDDDLNYQLALRLRRFYLRRENAWGCPQIRTSVWSDIMSSLLDKSPALSGVAGQAPIEYSLGHGHAGADAAAQQGIRCNPDCQVTLFGSMQESLLCDEQISFLALRYHNYYCGSQTLTIPLKHYHGYYTSSASNHRSSMAVAVHGHAKCAWVRYWYGVKEGLLPAAHEAQALDALARAEHRRWCIFELLEGSSAVPDDRLLQDHYLNFTKGRNSSSRDRDAVRGYHAFLRTWNALEELPCTWHCPGPSRCASPCTPTQAPKAGSLCIKAQKALKKSTLNNKDLSRFSLELDGLLIPIAKETKKENAP